jgi:hypothetical protein
MDTRSTPWPRIKRASIKIVVCVFGPSSTTVDDDDTETDTHYGQIEKVWELDYVGLKVALFLCRWFTNGKRAMSKDKYGYVSGDLQVFGYKNELFVITNDVEKVFYVPELAKKNWYVVMPGKKGLLGLKMLLRRRRNTIPSFDTSYKP